MSTNIPIGTKAHAGKTSEGGWGSSAGAIELVAKTTPQPVRRQSAWEQGRPVYLRLPSEEEGYVGNEVADALTLWLDLFLVDVKNATANFERDMVNPDTCRSDVLDWLAQHYGFTGEHWDATWSDLIKRQLIKYAISFIWPNKGRKILLEWLLALFSINALVLVPGTFIAGINYSGDLLGGVPLRYFIAMPLPSNKGYLRGSREWKLAAQFNRLYMPCYCFSLLCYKKFTAGISLAGDPLLNLGETSDSLTAESTLATDSGATFSTSSGDNLAFEI